MPKGSKHQSKTTTKLLNLGDAGGGKTGALASLLREGYRLIILDFDNGLDVLVNLVQDEPEVLDRLYYETFTDPMQLVGGKVIPKGTPKAFNAAMVGLTKWVFPEEPGSKETYDLGNISTWGPDTVVVIDSLGLAGIAALRLVRQLNAHQLDSFTSQPDYGQAMAMVEGMLQLLYADNVKCNVIVNTHITYIEDLMSGTLRGLPRALGSKLPPNVGGYFNTIVRTLTKGTGQSAKRIIRTSSETGLELKLPVKPGIVPAELPIETGLATLFKTLQSRPSVEKKS